MRPARVNTRFPFFRRQPFVIPVATTIPQFDRAEISERVLHVVRGLLVELGSHGALPLLDATSQFDRDLGLGSLERVELLARLETELGVRLPDRIVAEANTPEDLTQAILDISGAQQVDKESGSALRASVAVQKLRREAGDSGIFSTQTLIAVLQYRAVHDADRVHLQITEEDESGERSFSLTFGEL